jgi:MFS family permease
VTTDEATTTARRHHRTWLWPVVAAVTLLATSTLPPFLAGALAVQIQEDLGFGDRGLGLAVAAFFALAGLSGPLGGRIVDRIGWRAGTVLGAVGGAAVLLVIATVVPSLTVLLVVLILGGLVHGLTGPTSNLTLASELPTHRHGLGFGVQRAAIPIVTMLAGLSVPLIALTIGWRWAFAGAALIPLVSILAAVGTRTGTQSLGTHVRRRQRSHAIPMPREHRLPLIALAIAGGLGTISVGALGTFTVRTAVEAGLSVGAAGALVAIGSLAGLVARVFGGWLADRVGTNGFGPVAVMMTIGAVGFVLMATSRPILVALGILIAYGAGWGWAGLYILGVVSRYPNATGRATGIAQVGTAGGAAVGPLAFGLIVSRIGFGATWLLVAGTTLLAATLLLRAQRGHAARTAVPDLTVPSPAGHPPT